MRILHLEFNSYPESAILQLKKLGNVKEGFCNSQKELYAELSNEQFDVIFTRLGVYFDSKCFELQNQLRFLVTSTTGLNHIDLESAKKFNVKVISLKGEFEFLSNIRSTAEHTWALLLACIRQFRGAIQSTMEGNWNRIPYLSDELDGKTLGIIGYGRLGKIVAGYGLAFNMKVMVHDHNFINPTPSGILADSLDNVLHHADYLLLMISFSPENINFMSEEKFSQMKSGAYFINTSRGELVNENDLLFNLETGHLKGAGIDVLWEDSKWANKIEGSHELLDYARKNTNLIITPHMGGYGIESISKTREFVTQKFINSLN
jgi:D-3-phosphoglycerate dehydrogenase